MKSKTCNKCGANWLLQEDGEWQLYWATGKPAKEVDLAGLVCNSLGGDECINPCQGQAGGETWQGRVDRAKKDLEHPEIPGF